MAFDECMRSLFKKMYFIFKCFNALKYSLFKIHQQLYAYFTVLIKNAKRLLSFDKLK